MHPGVMVARMHLYRKLLRGEDKLDQEGKVIDAFEPHLPDFSFRIRKPRLQSRRAPDFFPKRRAETLRSHQTREAMNFCKRSRPRSSSFIEVAYEIRT